MKLRNIFAVALAGLAFTACNNDDVPNPGIGGGETAYVGLNLTLPANAFSKAADATDTNAEETETKVSKVTVYGQAQTAAAAVTKLADLTEADFTKTGNSYALKEASAIKVTGQVDSKMNIYVVLNSSDDLSTKLAGTPPTEHAAGVSSTAATNNFLMSNAEAGTATLKATQTEAVATGAKAEVKVERAVAKILVKAAATSSGGNLNLADQFEDYGKTGKFDGTTIRWAVGNSPKNIYVRKYDDGGTIKTPDYTYSSTDAYTDYVARYDVLTDASGVPNVEPTIPIMPNTVTSATGFDGATSYVGYSNENIHDTYVGGNTTYVLLMAKFVPNTTYESLTGTGSSMNGTDANVTTPQTFWYHNPSGRYVTDAAHTTYIAANAGETDNFVGPYTDGKCYYKIPVWDVTSDATKANGTERNTFYTLSVKSLTAPGKPTDTSVTEPNKPTEDPESYIGVDITIEPWKSASMGNDIELK